MFKCDNCGDQVGLHQPLNKVITERRNRNYENYPKRRIIESDRNKEFRPAPYRRNEQPFYTKGWEIIKEIAACAKCYTTLTGMQAQIREPVLAKRANPRFIDAESTRKYGNHERATQPKEHKERKPPVVETINPIKLEKS